MSMFKYMRVFFLLFCVSMTFFWTNFGHAFIVSANHNSSYALEVFLYHDASNRWIRQFFNDNVNLENIQFLGAYRHKDRIFYLVYYFHDQKLCFLSHDMRVLQENYQDLSGNAQKRITLESTRITPNEDFLYGDYFSAGKLIHVEALFSEADKNHVFVYNPTQFAWYSRADQLDRWWIVDQKNDHSEPSFEIVALGLHGDHAYYANKIYKGDEKRFLYFLKKGSLFPASHTGSQVVGGYFPTMRGIVLDNADERYNKHQVLYFDHQKNRYASLGRVIVPEVQKQSMAFVCKYAIGKSYASDKKGYWTISDEEYPYPSFLNANRTRYNILSFEQGLIAMFADAENNSAVIYSTIDGQVHEKKIDFNIGAKRSKLLLGDGIQRFIAVNNQSVYSSKDGAHWDAWPQLLPDTPNFQDVLWIPSQDKD